VYEHKDFVFYPKMNHLDVWYYNDQKKGGIIDAYN
jgi:hypothetical protein